MIDTHNYEIGVRCIFKNSELTYIIVNKVQTWLEKNRIQEEKDRYERRIQRDKDQISTAIIMNLHKKLSFNRHVQTSIFNNLLFSIVLTSNALIFCEFPDESVDLAHPLSMLFYHLN